MSKSLNEWKAVDYLLYCYNISHFHLHKNKNGGVRSELVFGVFTEDSFYAFCIGDHNDIYKPDTLLKLAYETWPNEIYDYNANFDSYDNFHQGFFKKQANISDLQFNKFQSIPIKNKDGEIVATVDNSKHTTLIDFTLNNVKYENMPLKAYCAYINEIKHIKEIEMSLVRNVGADKMELSILPEQKQYSVFVHSKVPFTKTIPFRKKQVLCTLYSQY